MKNAGIISSLTILFSGFLLLNFLNSWQLKGKVSPPEIKKAKPVESPKPENEKLPQKVKKDSSAILPSDSVKILVPLDSVKIDTSSSAIKDSIRSSQHIERKPDIRFYRRIRQYNLHKKLPVS